MAGSAAGAGDRAGAHACVGLDCLLTVRLRALHRQSSVCLITCMIEVLSDAKLSKGLWTLVHGGAAAQFDGIEERGHGGGGGEARGAG